jgi:hypothetical protein
MIDRGAAKDGRALSSRQLNESRSAEMVKKAKHVRSRLPSRRDIPSVRLSIPYMHNQDFMDAFATDGAEDETHPPLYGRFSVLRNSPAILVARIGGSSRLDQRGIVSLVETDSLSRSCFSSSAL